MTFQLLGRRSRRRDLSMASTIMPTALPLARLGAVLGKPRAGVATTDELLRDRQMRRSICSMVSRETDI